LEISTSSPDGLLIFQPTEGTENISGFWGSGRVPVNLKVAKRLMGKTIASIDAANHFLGIVLMSKT
jgi:hypothetical protein